MSAVGSTVCPFCNLGCRLGFEVKADEVRKVAYVGESRNQGRLCPRGNAAANIVNHPKRLYHALIKGSQASLAYGIDFLRLRLGDFKPEEILFLYDSSLTTEEIDALHVWTQASGFKNLAYAGIGPEKVFLYGKAAKPLPAEMLSGADYALILGDPYAQSSVLSGYLAAAKGDRRDFRYIVVDSTGTNTSHFAHKFVRVRPGFEGLFMYGLWRLAEGAEKELNSIASALDIDVSIFQAVAAMIRNKDGVLVNSPCSARSFDPLLTHASCLRVAKSFEQMSYAPVGPRVPTRVSASFHSYMPMLMAGKIKALVSFGAGFPWGLAQLRPVLRKADFVALSSLFIPEGRFEPDLVLPMASELEKKGTIDTLFGDETLSVLQTAISGTLSAGQYIDRISGSPLAVKEQLSSSYDGLDDSGLSTRAKALIELSAAKPKKGMKHLLLASESAIGFHSIFETEDWLKLNPGDAAALGIKEGEAAAVETEQGEALLKSIYSRDVPEGVAVLSANHSPSLALLELSGDAQIAEGFLKPTWSKIWKK